MDKIIDKQVDLNLTVKNYLNHHWSGLALIDTSNNLLYENQQSLRQLDFICA